MKMPKVIKHIVDYAVDSPQHRFGIMNMLIEFSKVVNVGITYSNPNYWKKINKKVPFIKGGVQFSDWKAQANYNEVMEFLSKGKQLNQEHIDFTRDFTIPLITEYLDKKIQG
jgi:hypothetical protein